VTTNLPNNGTYKAKIFTPAFRRQTVEGGFDFKGGFRFGIKLVIAKQPVSGW
jgi:hypothetical protein